MDRAKTIAWVSMVLATLFWAGNFAVGRVIFNQISPVMFNFLRWTVGLVFLSLFAFKRFGEISRALKNHYRWFLGMAIYGVVFHVLMYTALRYTTATNMALIMGATPATILILSAWLHGSRHALPRILIVGLSFCGVGVLVQENLAAPNLGDLIGCVSMVMWAYYSASLHLCPVKLDSLVLTIAITFAGVIIMLPLAGADIAINGLMPLNAEVVMAVLYVGLLASGLAFLFWNKGVVAMGPVPAGQFMNLVPVFGVLIGITVLGESFTARHALAAVLIIGGLLLSELFGRIETARGSLESKS